MFSAAIRDIATERASMMRDVEYIRENVEDSAMQETILLYECSGGEPCLESDIISREEKKEICEAIENIPDGSDEEEEIERILSSEKEALTLDEVMGITKDPSSDAEELLDAVADVASMTDVE